MTRWFEDIDQASVWPLGDYTFSKDEIIRFGTLYDPQYFHIDPKLAEHAHFNGLVASGWHTVCVGHRLMVDALFAEEERLKAEGEEPGVAGPSPGVNHMEFKAPVRPGDTVSYRLTVVSKRHSKSLPGWGVLINLIEAENQNGALVYSAEIASFSKLRDFKPSIMQRLAIWLASLPVVGKLLRRK